MGLLARDTPCAALPLRAPLSFLRFPQACKRACGGGGAPKWRGETCSLGGGACLRTGGGGGTVPCASVACMQRGRAGVAGGALAPRPGVRTKGGGGAWGGGGVQPGRRGEWKGWGGHRSPCIYAK